MYSRLKRIQIKWCCMSERCGKTGITLFITQCISSFTAPLITTKLPERCRNYHTINLEINLLLSLTCYKLGNSFLTLAAKEILTLPMHYQKPSLSRTVLYLNNLSKRMAISPCVNLQEKFTELYIILPHEISS